ncbi:MAG: DNA primase [Treponema sp.]|jgi:DNA primase|nr:DNA primase [Treponema sp.]
MARFTEASKQAVLDKIDALAVVEDYLRLEKKGGRYWGLCPFHHEKTPSFTVDPDRKFYYCFGCHKGGSVVSFIMEMDKLSFPEAMETLAKRFGVPLAYESGGLPGDSQAKERTEALEDLYQRMTGTFHHFLMKKAGGGAAKRYIMDRGVAEETIERFRLGYAPADRFWLYGFLSQKGAFSDDFLSASGLFAKRYPKSAFFYNRLMFPIGDKSGRIIAFGGRLLSGEGPKYLNSPDSELFKKGRALFALDLALPAIRAAKAVYLAEGYMDVIALHQGGIANAVAPLGTAFTDDQAKLLRRWADKVYLTLDNDEAGREAAFKAILRCRQNGLECAVVDTAGFFKGQDQIPKDPAEILQKFGPEVLKKSLECCILDLEYVISRGKALKEEKSRSVAFLFPYLDALDSEVSRDASIGAIADAFGVDAGAVRDDYRGTAGERPAGGPGAAPPETRGGNRGDGRRVSPRTGDELYLLAVIFVNPGLFKALRAALSLDDLEDPRARELYIILEEWYRESGALGRGTGGRGLIDRVAEGELRDFIMRGETSGAFANPEKLLGDGVLKIKGKILERKRRDIIRELRDPALKADTQGDLLSEKMYIDAELTRLRVGE